MHIAPVQDKSFLTIVSTTVDTVQVCYQGHCHQPHIQAYVTPYMPPHAPVAGVLFRSATKDRFCDSSTVQLYSHECRAGQAYQAMRIACPSG